MIYYDVTKAARSSHRSGLLRVSLRLGDELRGEATGVRWAGRGWCIAVSGRSVKPAATDWLLTGELFSEEERPGFSAWMDARTCRLATIFHDAIPLQLPQITWPQSVARHPGYLKLLAKCDCVWAVSAASGRDLSGYWRWLGITVPPPVKILALGADIDGSPRRPATVQAARVLLCVGIIEPRKNQEFLLEVCEELWREGLDFELHLAGRVNPHFGRLIAKRLRAMQREFAGLHHHPAADDSVLAGLFARARATVFPTRAEGCGLPLIESLWHGVPCVASDLPVLRENAAGGGCLLVPLEDRAGWTAGLRRVLTVDAFHAELATQAARRELPTWAGAAEQLRASLLK
jgi:glycosyltransferase involved in cell wall biosynthesis